MINYVGIDTTDPFALNPREVAVATLDIHLRVHELITVPMENVKSLRGSILSIDGPQGLASPGNNVRVCEKALRTPGRTPSTLPEAGTRPFAGYLRGNVLLFDELIGAGRTIQENLIEVFPGAAWPLFTSTRLAKKTTPQGIQERARILTGCGITGIPTHPNHDQLDAIMAAYLAAEFDTGNADLVGAPIYHESSYWREGYIVQPKDRRRLL